MNESLNEYVDEKINYVIINNCRKNRKNQGGS